LSPIVDASLRDKHVTKKIQDVLGRCPYDSLAVDPNLLPALNETPSQQAQPTEDLDESCQQLKDRLNTHRKAIINLQASDKGSVTCV